MKIMKHLLWCLTIFSSTFFYASCAQTASHPNIQRVEVEEFMEVLQDSTVVLIDVRTPEEHQAGFIPGTKFNFNILDADFAQETKQVLSPDAKVAIYCRSGNRSQRAAKILSEQGFQVIELSSGYKGYVQQK